jgi:polar amino acid transport system substrate-binding protein
MRSWAQVFLFFTTLSFATALSLCVPLIPAAMAQDIVGPSGTAPPPALPKYGTAVLRGGWIMSKPYQFPVAGQLQGVEGLDITILTDVLQLAGIEANLRRQSWHDQLQYLAEGRGDIALGAFKPDNGDDRFHYSLPYRWARISLYVRKDETNLYNTTDIAKLINELPDFRLGVVPGRLFADSALNGSIKTATRAGRIVNASSDEENLRNLLAGRIDGFVGDRLGVSTSALEAGLKFQAAEIVMPGIASVHFIFSKTTMQPKTLAAIDQAIKTLEDNGQLKKRLHSGISSVLMSYVLDTTLFYILTIVGTVAFAVSGVLIAYRENFSFFGALVLSALPALGGGALRDILLDRHPMGMMSSPLYLCLVGVTVLVGFSIILAMRLLAGRGWTLSRLPKAPRFLTMANIQELADSMGMAVFTVSGLAIAISMDAEPLWLWGPIIAMLTAAGGGILRDIVRQSGQVGTLKTELYAEVPFFWGLAFSVFLLTRPDVLAPEEIQLAIIITVLGTFLTRMTVVLLGVRPFPFSWTPKASG